MTACRRSVQAPAAHEQEPHRLKARDQKFEGPPLLKIVGAPSALDWCDSLMMPGMHFFRKLEWPRVRVSAGRISHRHLQEQLFGQ